MNKIFAKHCKSRRIRDYKTLVCMLLFFLTIMGVKASVGIIFNSNVRYSQRTINSRAHDSCANTTGFGVPKYGINSQSTQTDNADAVSSGDQTVTIANAELAKITSGAVTSGAITLTPNATNSGIYPNSDNGFKIKGGGFTISAKDGAKIKSVTVSQNSANRELAFTPKGDKTNTGTVFTYTYTDYPSEISVEGPSSSLTITSIAIEYVINAQTKTDFSASFANTTISATEGDASMELPALIVKAGTANLTSSDYTVVYTSNNETVAKVENGKIAFGSKGNATITAEITPKDARKYNGTTANFSVSVAEKSLDPTKDNIVYDFVNNVGVTINGTNCTSANGKITLGSDYRGKEKKYISIAPSNGGFKVGDIITIKGYCDSKNASGVEIHSNATAESIFKTNTLAKSTNGGSEYTFTLTEDCDSLFFGRFGGGNTYITSLTVTRPADSGMSRLTASFAKANDVVLNTVTTIVLPALTVKAGENELSASDYSVTYLSNAEDVVSVLSDGKLSIKGIGVATITAIIGKVTIDGTDYEGCTATYQITVKAPSQLNISVYDVTVNTTDAEVEQPVIRVYGDNDQLLKLGTDYTLSFTVKSGSNVSVADGIFKISGNAYAWTKGTTVFTVTATPTSSLGETYTAGSVDFSYDVVEGKNKPAFLASFAQSGDIKLRKDKKTRTFTVPLIYDGEDVSDYFDYSYTINGANAGTVKGNVLTYTTNNEGTFVVKVNATAKSTYTDVYDNPDEMSFTLDVKTTYDLPVVELDPVSISMYTGTTDGLPDVTVKVNNAFYDESKYTEKWTSFAPGIVKINESTGRIEAVTEGTARIRVTIKGDNIETKTAFATIYVDDPALYRIKATGETYGNQRIMWNQDKNLSVVLGGWMFPMDGKPEADLTGEKLTSSYVWKDNSSKAKWKLTGFDYYVAGDDNKNARQENGSNSMPETTTISNVDYSKTKTIVDPMFNVPASGSYLVFNPKTNGTVTAHIFQNGVFDKTEKDGKTNYQYRPQRRVFVMDEAGNFVSSDAHIESTTGKPTGGQYDLSQYTWDMGKKGSPTVDLVKSHFTGLTDFTMTQDGFKNNVYESNLGQDVAPNKAAEKYPDILGSHGWCVLADSPVTYTFKVKAGKTYYLYNFGSKIGFYGFSFEEDANAPIVDNISFDENLTNDVKATEEGHVAAVSINRSFKKNVWTTCVLPFSLNKQQVDAIFGTTYSVSDDGSGKVELHNDGTQILYFDRVEGSKAHFVRHAYNTIVAGKPFLIKPAKDVESINTANIANYPYVTIENTQPADWCKSNGYVWKSSYSNGLVVEEGDCFISNGDGSFKNYKGVAGTLKAFRGFLQLEKTAGAKPRMLSIATNSNVEENGSTTGINDLFVATEDSIAPNAKAGKIYNINGQLVSDDVNSFSSLPSGVYIINGKKFIK